MIPKIWNNNTYQIFINELINIRDLKYKKFHQSLVLDSKYEILGIRIPVLRKIAKQIYKETNYIDFINIKKGKYMEEILIEGFVIGNIDTYEIDKYIKKFIYKIDNWCICDTFCSSLKIVKKNKEKYFNFFTKEIDLSIDYGIRTSLVVLNSYYVEDEYIDKIFDYINNIKNDSYYVSMGIAWLVSTCYIKCEEKTLMFLNNNTLNDFTYNKSIQKIIESNRVDKKNKDILRKMKR